MAGTFVTGGTGFLGGALLERLRLEQGTGPVRALARDRTGGETVAGHDAEPVMGDVLAPASLDAGMAGCEIVYHVAGVNEFCQRDSSEMFRVNVSGSVNVIEAAARAGVRRVVYTSSATTLGEEAGTVGSESSPHRASYLSRYERSKHEAEQAVLATADRFGLDVVVVNPASVQGPGRSTGTARLLIDYLDGRLRAEIDTRLSIVDIDDSALGHVLAAVNGVAGERYVLSAPWMTIADARQILDEVTGTTARVLTLPGWAATGLATVAEGAARLLGRRPSVCREMVRVLRHGHAYDGSRATRDLGLDYLPVRHTLVRTVSWLVEFGFIRRELPNITRS